jgi:uncharacterized protein YwgA
MITMILGADKVAWLVEFLGIPIKKLTNPDSFDDRLKVQKAVFLLKHLGISPFKDYDFNLYLRGPYSPILATCYYKLEEVKPTPVDLGGKEELLKWFIEHPTDWLEVASSIISIKERYPKIKNEETYDILRLSKPWVNRTLFESIIKDLRMRGLV